MGVMVACQDILAKAKVEGADIIGLSGLITPSLEEMQHVAARDAARRLLPHQEDSAADRRRDDEPRPHRGQDRAALRRPGRLRARRQPLGRRLQRAALRRPAPTAYIAELEADYERVRAQHANKKATPLVTLAEARANKTPIDWARLRAAGAEVHRPPRAQEPGPGRDRRGTSTGARSSRPGTSPAPYPAILTDEIVGESARRVFSDGKRMLQPRDRRALADAPTASSASTRRPPSATTTSRSTPTRRAARCCSPGAACACRACGRSSTA